MEQLLYYMTVFVTVIDSGPPADHMSWIALAIDDAGSALHDDPELSAQVASAVGDATTTDEYVARRLELTRQLRP